MSSSPAAPPHAPPASLHTSPFSPTSPPTASLQPLELGTVKAIYLDQTQEVVQISLSADAKTSGHTGADVKALYAEVHEDVTDLIALVLHLHDTEAALPPALRFDSRTKGYRLSCERKRPSKTLSRWLLTKDGVEVKKAPCKYRFSFGVLSDGG